MHILRHFINAIGNFAYAFSHKRHKRHDYSRQSLISFAQLRGNVRCEFFLSNEWRVKVDEKIVSADARRNFNAATRQREAACFYAVLASKGGLTSRERALRDTCQLAQRTCQSTQLCNVWVNQCLWHYPVWFTAVKARESKSYRGAGNFKTYISFPHHGLHFVGPATSRNCL